MKPYLFTLIFSITLGLFQPVHAEQTTDPLTETSEVTEVKTVRPAEVFSDKKDTFWGNLWEKLKVKIKLKIIDQNVSNNDYNLGIRLDYEGISKPAFIKDFHQRLDIWTVKLNLGYEKSFNIGSDFFARVSFSRLFDEKNLSLSEPYYPNRIPLTTKEAIDKLSPGDAIRIEFSSDPYFGKTKEDLFNSKSSWNADLKLS
nr:hypothetical protein [Pseudobdellovibrionaceae bacterium]